MVQYQRQPGSRALRQGFIFRSVIADIVLCIECNKTSELGLKVTVQRFAETYATNSDALLQQSQVQYAEAARL
jgi:hypothetical protein